MTQVMKHMVEDLMISMHGRLPVEELTVDSYQRWDREYVFDALMDQRYGQAFCNYFGITDNLLFYERDAERARRYIQTHYL